MITTAGIVLVLCMGYLVYAILRPDRF
ncbi:MAG: K(+)-transporting ATPase subunit F [Desulfobacterales bacterium]|nr:K(+)-transporting ATPase subunit F [Desulfobacterales bacterium]